MNKENKVISIAVGDRLQIEGVGTVELVVVAPEQFKGHTKEQAMQIGGEWCKCHTDLVMSGKWVAAYKGFWYSHLEGKLKTLNPDQKLKTYHCHSFSQSYFYKYFNNPIDFSKPEQPKQHPLVGKWVRCVDAKKAMLFQENKWYQCVENPENSLAFIDKRGNLNGFYGANHNHFDLSNPCDFDCNLPEAINPKYKVGDEVVVVDKDHSYTTYGEANWFLGLKNKGYNNGFQNTTKAKVFGVCKHKDESTNLYALRDSEGNECVISEEGIILAGINKQEWLDAASRLFDSWMKISGGYVPKDGENCYCTYLNQKQESIKTEICDYGIYSPLNFEETNQNEQFLSENEKDLKTFFHQV